MQPDPHSFPQPGEARGVEHTGVIDLLTHDRQEGRAELVMFEPRPWDGGEEQLFQLQEKLNAYISFVLDGEYTEAYPQLRDTPLCVVLRCREEPPEAAVEFLIQVREQIALQGIDLEVRFGSGGCGECGCGA